MLRVGSKKGEGLEDKVDDKIVLTDDDKRREKLIQNTPLNPKNLQAIIKRLESADPTIAKPIVTYAMPKRSVSFLIIGDVHMNSAERYKSKNKKQRPLCDFEKWKKVVKIAEDRGAEFIIQTGDVTDGEGMRPFQKFGLTVQGFDAVADFCANEWPESKLPTFFIGGNHDQSYHKLVDADICEKIASMRQDLYYLGLNEGNIPLQSELRKQLMNEEKVTDKNATWIRVLHPGDGSAMGRSYKTQKIVESLPGKAKPHILIIGHYHKQDYLFYRNVHAFNAGTMQKQSDWMRRKNLAAHLLGTLVTVHYHANGTIALIDHQRLEYEINGAEGFENIW